MTFIKTAAPVLAILAGFSPAMAADVPVFVPHRAIYDLSLVKSTGTSAPTSVRGRIAFDFSGSLCEGFVTTFRQVTELQPSEGESRTSDMRSTTFEDGPGKMFRFKIETLVNGRPSETIDGSAQKSDDDDALSISLRAPKILKQDFGVAPLFPTQQMRALIIAAKAGTRTFEAKVFDGSDTGEKIFDTLTVIGAPASAGADDPALREALKSTARWPMVVSYFDPGKPDATPSYILGFDLYENGVSGNLRLDYGDFVLAGTMSKYEPLPVKECR